MKKRALLKFADKVVNCFVTLTITLDLLPMEIRCTVKSVPLLGGPSIERRDLGELTREDTSAYVWRLCTIIFNAIPYIVVKLTGFQKM